MINVTFEISEDIHIRKGLLRRLKGESADKDVLHALD
jgi:hypothetical protein